MRRHHRELEPLIARLLPPDGIVLDVGAHAGQFTKLFAGIAAAGRVYAFEPAGYARSILRTVVWLHRLDNVTVLPMALGAAAGIDMLSLPVKRRGSLGFGLSHLGPPPERWAAVAREPVAVVTLDMAAAALALDRLDFVKADIEGWELQLLRGGERTLRRFRPVLLMELLGGHLARAGDRIDDAFALLADLGYRALALSPACELVPAAAAQDGEFWFLSRDHPAIGML